ncbi:MAG TPA: nuclease [candidate division Zixibacteria bacterium]|nr:nuclease [candidate division Zixibacteria bacterium]
MRKLLFATLLVVLAIVLVPTLANTWGDTGHLSINRTAIEKAPADMPAFFKSNPDYIAYDGPEPDRWRSNLEEPLNRAQAPDHFIDMEYVDWMKPLPSERYAYIRAIYERRAQHPEQLEPEKVGFQPYITIEVFDRLKVAFREYRHAQKEGRPTANAEANALFYAAWLGHYVGDGANPLHTTKQYNGWVGDNPNGYTTEHTIHSKMETAFVNANPEVTKFADLVGTPRHLDHPFEDYIAYLRESQGKVEKVYQLDKACGFEGKGSPESREFIRQQMGRGAQMLLNMWYTAWVDSAQDPEPWHDHGDKKPHACEAK